MIFCASKLVRFAICTANFLALPLANLAIPWQEVGIPFLDVCRHFGFEQRHKCIWGIPCITEFMPLASIENRCFTSPEFKEYERKIRAADERTLEIERLSPLRRLQHSVNHRGAAFVCQRSCARGAQRKKKETGPDGRLRPKRIDYFHAGLFEVRALARHNYQAMHECGRSD